VVSAPAGATTRERALWRSVAIPSEHGGWGLTLEPVLAGLLIAFSWPGVALGVAALAAFVARTPLKLALVDRRRGRSLPRTRLATKIAAAEVLVALLAVGAASAGAGWTWSAPLLLAAPLIGVELWFDARSRSRRLVPELCGAVGIAAAAPAIVLAGDGDAWLAGGLWLVLAGRVVASVPFVRTQIDRLHHRTATLGRSDAFQVGGALIGLCAALADRSLLAGGIAVVAVAAAQARWLRRPVPAAKVLGITQMALGFVVVGITAGGVLLT
jgi:hypothetical protein